MCNKRVRPRRPSRDRTHVDRKRQSKIEATGTFDEWVEHYLDALDEHFSEVKKHEKQDTT